MELSRDKIKEIINDDWLLMDDCEGNKNCDVVKEMARIALASLEAEPVAWLLSGGGAKNNVSFDSGNAYADPLREVTPLYTAPPAPVSVPAAMEIDDDFDSAFEHGKAVGWNAYRAAMLQSGNFRENKNSSTNNFREIAETSTNYPVIPSEVLSAIQKVAKIRADFDDFDGDRRGIGDCLDEAEQELIVTINKYASQLAAEPIAPNDVREQTAIPQVPVTPDGWVIVPKKLTAENGAKGVLSGEFSETTFISCPECFGDDDCETCDCSGRIEIKVPVSWTTIKTIWAKGCEHFSIVAPQQDG